MDYCNFKRRRLSGREDTTPASSSVSPSNRFRYDTSTEPIIIDVSGTKFKVARDTIINNTTYFESLLSDRWNQDALSSSEPTESSQENTSNNDSKQPSDQDFPDFPPSSSPQVLFIDHDPAAFEILLTHMRTGLVHLPPSDPYLAKKALLLAEYLGIQAFLTTVKAITMKNISRRGDYLGDETSEAVQFDARFGSLRSAVDRGILPTCFFPPKDVLAIRVADRTFHASKAVLMAKSGYFGRYLTSNPEDYWKEEYLSGENPDVMEVAIQMMSSPNSAFTTMTEKFHSVSGQNVKFRHFYVQAILTWLDKLQLPVDFRDNCVQTITHTFNA
mmetsp:Transcript_4865/g.9924  ORF Transcript_4865/g.9924 Transcript_4865/m.9924 type:complete len:330 (+) Transcript_4865:52-1041(+)